MTNLTSFKLEENVPLAPFTTLRVGGPARFFARCLSENDVEAAVRHSDTAGLKLLVFGGGSNIVVSDRGFEGLALQVAIPGISFSDESDQGGRRNSDPPSEETNDADAKCIVSVNAGEEWDRFVSYCVERGLAGVECLSGIPGLVGAAPVQNIGAYGQDVSETIVSVKCFDRELRKFAVLRNEDCGFDYRKSIFNSVAQDRYIIVAVQFRLTVNGRPKIKYRDLQDHCTGIELNLRQMREAVLSIRRSKSMVIERDDPNSLSVGSFFKNPFVSRSQFAEIAAEFSQAEVPHFKGPDGQVKIPAAWLIENAGFCKGFRLGNASISTKHTLAIVNAGGATASEIVGLRDLISKGVKDRFGINLVPEPVFIGFSS